MMEAPFNVLSIEISAIDADREALSKVISSEILNGPSVSQFILIAALESREISL
jgi:hypothetical protein